MTRRGLPRGERAVVAALAGLLPAAFRARQRAEWTADLTDLAAAGAAVRWRYLLAAAWTLPALRALVRSGRSRTPLRLLGRGVRARLGRPGTPGIVVLAALVALLAGQFGAAGATRIGWELTAPLPNGAQAEELKRTVFPGVAVAGGGDAPFWTVSPDGEYVEAGHVRYSVEPTETRDIGGLTPGVRDRLAAAGWRIDASADEAVPGGMPTRDSPLRATRGDLTLTYSGGADFTVARSVPSWLWAFAAAGALLGALIGWLLTGWAGRRAEEGSPAGQLAGLIAWPTVTVMLVLLPGGMLLRPATQTWHDGFYLRLLYIAGGPPRWVGAVAVVALAIVLILGRPGRRVTRS